MLALRKRLCRRLDPGEPGLGGAALTGQEARNELVVPDQEWRDQHAHGDRGKQRLRELHADQPVVEEQREQREAELAAGREHDARAQRLEPLAGKGSGGEQHNGSLDYEESREQRNHRGQLGEQRGHVELHADRHEEEAEQRVAEWPDPGLDLVTVFRLRKHHARKEAAQRKGESRRMRRPGGADRDEQHGKGEDFRRAVRCDLVEERAKQPSSRGQHDDERDGRLRDRECDLGRRVLVLRRCEHAGECEEGNDREVLEEEHAECEPAVSAVELVLFGQQAQDDRGR